MLDERKQELVHQWSPYVLAVARKWAMKYGCTDKLDDLRAIANYTLVSLADKYDMDSGIPFKAIILGTLKYKLRDAELDMQGIVSRRTENNTRQWETMFVELDEAIINTVGHDDEEYINAKIDFEKILEQSRTLNPREKVVMYMMYYEGMNRSDVARELGLSREAIRLRHDSALEKLRKSFVEKKMMKSA